MAIYCPNIEIPRPIPAFRSDTYILENLSDITVIFGKNGSGKSILLRTWRNTNFNTIHYVTPERMGNLNFEPGLLSSQGTPDARRAASQENYSSNYREQIMARIQVYLTMRGAQRNEDFKGNPAELEYFIDQLFPDFSLTLTGKNPPYDLYRRATQERIRGVNELSSGEAQLLTVGLDILTIAAIWEIDNLETRILLIDEPDAHIHPDLQVRFADFVLKIIERFGLQIVIATHSTTLLSALGQFGGERTSVIYFDKQKARFKGGHVRLSHTPDLARKGDLIRA